MSTPIAILASGRGTNFEAIHDAIAKGALDAEIKLVISDQPAALVLEKARSRKITALCIDPGIDPGTAPRTESSAHGRRTEHEGRILEALEKSQPRFLVLAGYMRILTPRLIEAFRSERGYSRIVNIHPSLLPAFPGVSAYSQAFEHGSKLAGVTVHLVEVKLDSGPICAQESFTIEGCASAEEVESKGLAVEHRLYPETLKWLLPEVFSVEKRPGGRFCVRAD